MDSEADVLRGRHYVVREVTRADPALIAALAAAGVATAHEAAGRVGLLSPDVQARQHDTTVAGSAVTVLSPPGDNLITFMCTLNPDDPSEVLITAVPQIRSRDLKTTIVTDPAGQLQAVKAPEIFAFSQMTFRLPVPNNDLLVIGPSAASRRPQSVGNRVLVKTRDGMEYETVFVLIPEVFWAPLGDRR